MTANRFPVIFVLPFLYVAAMVSCKKSSPTQPHISAPTATWTVTATSSVTATPTLTAIYTFTETVTPSATESATATGTPTPSPSATSTPMDTATSTPSATASPTGTPTNTWTPSPTASWTSTDTVTPSPSATATWTSTPTLTATPSSTDTQTATETPTDTATATATPTATVTATPTVTPTPTDTPCPPFVSDANTTLLEHFDGSCSVVPVGLVKDSCSIFSFATPGVEYVPAAGWFGQALYLKRPTATPGDQNNSAYLPYNPSLLGTTGSIEIRLYPFAFPAGIVSGGPSPWGCGGWVFHYNIDAEGYVNVYMAGTTVKSDRTIPRDQWTKLTLSWTPSSLLLYFDGTLVASAGSHSTGFGSVLMFFAGADSGNVLLVDELRFSNVARTPGAACVEPVFEVPTLQVTWPATRTPTTTPTVTVTPTVTTTATATSTPYQHTIPMSSCSIADFDASTEMFDCTSAGFGEYVTWDSANLYFGYLANELSASAGSTTKWILIYVDTDPGAGTGATTSLMLGTQASAFPSGFGAEHVLGWKFDNTIPLKRAYSGGSWNNESYSASFCKGSNYLKLSIPRSAFGNPAKVGLTTFFVDETTLAEWTYSGLYNGAFTDGYSPAIGKYLLADFSSSLAPNNALNIKP